MAKSSAYAREAHAYFILSSLLLNEEKEGGEGVPLDGAPLDGDR